MILDRQKALKELEIPEKIYDELLQIFLVQAVESLNRLDEAIINNDHQGIERAAHFIKGSSGNLRIDLVYNLAKEIETAAKANQDIKVIEGIVLKMKLALEELKKSII